MRRQNKQLSPDAAEQAWSSPTTPTGQGSVVATCRLVTPMYGGGVCPGKVDCEMPIRPSAIRGQLRFWWRLLYGRGLPSKAMFQKECDLWGGISDDGPRASGVSLKVSSTRVGDDELVRWKGQSRYPKYALILDSRDSPRLLEDGYSFDLSVEFGFTDENKRRQVIDALRWWASFGGVGSRVRRGLGAVRVTSEHVELKPVKVSEVESRNGRLALSNQSSGLKKGIEAWKAAVDSLQRFRQGPGVGRASKGRNRPGGSNWPEARAIRRLSRRRKRPVPRADVFPRAAFGLPIVFHFKGRGEPRDSTLVPDGHDRMASPLILRPYWNGNIFQPGALLLPGWKERVSVHVHFKPRLGGAASVRAWPHDDGQRREAARHIRPMNGRGHDALSAFITFFESGGR